MGVSLFFLECVCAKVCVCVFWAGGRRKIQIVERYSWNVKWVWEYGTERRFKCQNCDLWMSSSEMVGELKCEFDVSSQCVTEEWSFTFAHDAVKHLYAGMPRAGQRERKTRGKNSHHTTHTLFVVATITNNHFGTTRIYQMKTMCFSFVQMILHKLQWQQPEMEDFFLRHLIAKLIFHFLKSFFSPFCSMLLSLILVRSNYDSQKMFAHVFSSVRSFIWMRKQEKLICKT